jgi:hypothetical protein
MVPEMEGDILNVPLLGWYVSWGAAEGDILVFLLGIGALLTPGGAFVPLSFPGVPCPFKKNFFLNLLVI